MTHSTIAATDRPAGTPSSPAALRFFAHLVSSVFHPLFISAYVMGFLIFFHPYAFAGFDHKIKVLRFLHIVLINALFPAFAVFLLWRLKFIQSILLHTEKERIIPYLISMIFYWWSWNVFKHLPDSPPVAIHFLLGAFLSVCGAWICNIYFKVSMHAVAMGGMLMFILLFSFHDEYASGLYLALALLVTGLVCTSRLLLSAHSIFQVWAGLFVGLLAQYVAWQF
jgi:hypothetical protein